MLFYVLPRSHALIVGRDDITAVVDIYHKYQNYLCCNGKIGIYDNGDGRYYVEFKTTEDRWYRMLQKFDRIASVKVRD